MAPRGPPVLLGRDGECQALDRRLKSVRDGQSAVLVVRSDNPKTKGGRMCSVLDMRLEGADVSEMFHAGGVEVPA
jgi:hypothetical protein